MNHFIRTVIALVALSFVLVSPALAQRGRRARAHVHVVAPHVVVRHRRPRVVVEVPPPPVVVIPAPVVVIVP